MNFDRKNQIGVQLWGEEMTHEMTVQTWIIDLGKCYNNIFFLPLLIKFLLLSHYEYVVVPLYVHISKNSRYQPQG